MKTDVDKHKAVHAQVEGAKSALLVDKENLQHVSQHVHTAQRQVSAAWWPHGGRLVVD